MSRGNVSRNSPVALFIEETEFIPGTVLTATPEQMTILIPDDTPPLQGLKGWSTRVRFVNQKGCHDFIGKIIDQSYSPPAITLEIKEVQSRQQRGYFRWEVDLPAISATSPSDVKECRLVDISGGGARIISDTPMVIGDEFELRFILPDGPIALQSRVVRNVPTDKRQPRYVYGVEFVGITDRDRNRVVNFIFSEQANSRRFEK